MSKIKSYLHRGLSTCLQHAINPKNVAVFFKLVKTQEIQYPRLKASGNYHFVTSILRQKRSICQALSLEMEKLLRKNRNLARDVSWRFIKKFHKKKLKSISKHSQVSLTIKHCIIKSKKAPLSFKFVKTQGMSGSQDQKKWKLTVRWQNFFWKKDNSAFCICNDRYPDTWWMEQQLTHQVDSTSHKLFWRMKKGTKKNRSKDEHVKRRISDISCRKSKVTYTEDCQHVYNTLSTQKMSQCFSNLWKLKKFSIRDLKQVETTILWQLYWGKNTQYAKHCP